VVSDMVMDPDYTPEGIASQMAYRFNDVHTLRLNGGAFVLDELSGTQKDPFLAGGQVRWDANWNAKLQTTLGLAGLILANEGSITNSQVPNINRGNAHNANGTLTYGYHAIVADASIIYSLDSAPFYTGAFPIKVGGEYMLNPEAPSSADNYAYSVGVTFGKSGKRKTWEAGYTYKYLGGNSWWEELTDSDFGAFYAANNSPANSGANIGYGSGTNVKGHIMRIAYSPNDSLTLSVKWFLTDLIKQYPSGSKSDMSRLQLDALWKF